MNNLFKQLNPAQTKGQQNQGLSSNNNLFKNLLNNSNPQGILNSIISNNPQAKNLINLLQTSGMTPKQFFYHYARQNGVDPDQFLSSLTSGKE